jgi:NADH dehydrogenase FAD-containing subunit
MAKTIVILGASYAGVPIAHYLLKHTATKVAGLKVILVAPNTHLLWNFATVRGILPNMLGDDKLFLPIAPAFEKYPSEQYELVQGMAEGVDPSTKTVAVRGNDGSARAIQYDDL